MHVHIPYMCTARQYPSLVACLPRSVTLGCPRLDPPAISSRHAWQHILPLGFAVLNDRVPPIFDFADGGLGEVGFRGVLVSCGLRPHH